MPTEITMKSTKAQIFEALEQEQKALQAMTARAHKLSTQVADLEAEIERLKAGHPRPNEGKEVKERYLEDSKIEAMHAYMEGKGGKPHPNHPRQVQFESAVDARKVFKAMKDDGLVCKMQTSNSGVQLYFSEK